MASSSRRELSSTPLLVAALFSAVAVSAAFVVVVVLAFVFSAFAFLPDQLALLSQTESSLDIWPA